MHIQHKKVNEKGMFYIQEDGDIVAELVYSEPAPNRMVIEHTEVDDQLRGENVGYELVHQAVEYARSHHYSIVPVCPFARKIFEKKPDFRDVLA